MAEIVKKEALKDDKSALCVVVGSRTLILDGEDGDGDANLEDISVKNFSASARALLLIVDPPNTVIIINT